MLRPRSCSVKSMSVNRSAFSLKLLCRCGWVWRNRQSTKIVLPWWRWLTNATFLMRVGLKTNAHENHLAADFGKIEMFRLLFPAETDKILWLPYVIHDNDAYIHLRMLISRLVSVKSWIFCFLWIMIVDVNKCDFFELFENIWVRSNLVYSLIFFSKSHRRE